MATLFVRQFPSQHRKVILQVARLEFQHTQAVLLFTSQWQLAFGHKEEVQAAANRTGNVHLFELRKCLRVRVTVRGW